MPRSPHPGASTPVPWDIFLSLRTACCRTVLIAHQTPSGLAPANSMLCDVTDKRYPSEVGLPAASRNADLSPDNVQKIAPSVASLPSATEALMPMPAKSSRNVSANSQSVGGTVVRPSLSRAVAWASSTTMECTLDKSKAAALSIAWNGTVGIPSKSAFAVSC